MLDIVSKTIGKYNMLKKSERVLIGLSGGADSVSLLLCLLMLGYDITACHINHQLRDKESLRDELFCIDLCKKFNVPIKVHRIDVASYCKNHACSTEEGARALRYEIFAKTDCDKIATAHTLSDCFETTVFNLTRGTGLKGLCSIPPVRNNIIRPLIECTRTDIERFLLENKQDYVIDSTNLQTDYSRNKIRHNVVPILNELNPSLLSTYMNTLENLKNDQDYLVMQVSELLNSALTHSGYKADILLHAHPAIRNRAIAQILIQNNINVSFNRISDIISILNGGKINLQSDIFAVCNEKLLYIERFEQHDSDTYYCKEINFNQSYIFFDKTVSFEMVYNKNVNKNFANTCCDYDKIKGRVLLRNRQSGDKIILCNRNFTSSVKKLFNSSVTLENRMKTVILEDEEGIFFIEGFGCADRVKVDSDTKHILICKTS